MYRCWEEHSRFDGSDVITTVMRRMYIPPLMDMFQDIVVMSRYRHTHLEKLEKYGDNNKGEKSKS